MRAAWLVLTLAWLAAPGVLASPPEPTAEPVWLDPVVPMHLADRLWPLPLGGRLGWATTSAVNPDSRHAPARVFLLRGSGIFLTPDYGKLCTRLRQAGLWAEDLRSVGDHWVCRRLIAEHHSGRLGGPVILVGHSRGGRHVLSAAHELQKAGVTVDLVICLDVALPSAVPGNVVQALNVYLTHHRLYPAGALGAAAGSAAHIENLDLSAPDSPIDGRGLHHLNLTASPAVQDLIVERILQVARDRPGPIVASSVEH
jgi:hypothetical protein